MGPRSSAEATQFNGCHFFSEFERPSSYDRSALITMNDAEKLITRRRVSLSPYSDRIQLVQSAIPTPACYIPCEARGTPVNTIMSWGYINSMPNEAVLFCQMMLSMPIAKNADCRRQSGYSIVMKMIWTTWPKFYSKSEAGYIRFGTVWSIATSYLHSVTQQPALLEGRSSITHHSNGLEVVKLFV